MSETKQKTLKEKYHCTSLEHSSGAIDRRYRHYQHFELPFDCITRRRIEYADVDRQTRVPRTGGVLSIIVVSLGIGALSADRLSRRIVNPANAMSDEMR